MTPFRKILILIAIGVGCLIARSVFPVGLVKALDVVCDVYVYCLVIVLAWRRLG